MSISATLVRKLTEIDPPLREAMLLLVEEMERQQEQMAQQVTKAELRELQEVVQELAVSVNRLAEAQVRTEERLNELATTQARTEERLNELAAAQARTEERLERLEAAVERLAEAQARTEERLNELAAAQARTEEELRKLAAEHRVTRERLEGISNTVGYTLEDRAYKALPAILAQQGIQVEGRLIRRYVQLKEKERQVDIFGHGRRNGEQVLILGEAKVRPSRREVDRFVRLARQVAAVERMPPVLVFVAYDFPPAVEAYIKEQDILPVWSYELE